jgi:hypothetical protein
MYFSQEAQLDCIVAAILSTRLIQNGVDPQDALSAYARMPKALREAGGAVSAQDEPARHT